MMRYLPMISWYNSDIMVSLIFNKRIFIVCDKNLELTDAKLVAKTLEFCNVSVNQASIALDNGLSTIQHQAITKNNSRLLSIEQTSVKFQSKYQTFHSSEYIVCEMAAILSRGRWINFTIVFRTCNIIKKELLVTFYLSWHFINFWRMTSVMSSGITCFGYIS